MYVYRCRCDRWSQPSDAEERADVWQRVEGKEGKAEKPGSEGSTSYFLLLQELIQNFPFPVLVLAS